MTDFAHALSIDVEDWFQVLNLQKHVARDEWDDIPLRCGDSTRRLLDLLDKRGAKATFFFLGWIAERLPDLVRDVQSAGHEIGSHGYDHQLLDVLGEEGFREDLRRTSDILEELSGERPSSFRACTWSVTKKTLWAPRTLAEQGITLDSSIQPIPHPDYGIPNAPATPYRLQTEVGEIDEFPPLTWKVGPKRIPVGGGGYLRLFPTWMFSKGLRQHEKLGWPGCIYLHPWEVDPDQPRQDVGGLRGFRHYVNLSKMLDKLDALLQRHRFVGMREALAQCESWREKWPTLAVSGLSG